MSSYECRVCGSSELKATHRFREMMFGLQEEFAYDECARCASLQISVIPDAGTMGKYYPKNYYSFSQTDANGRDPGFVAKARHWLMVERDKAELGQFTPVGLALKTAQPALMMQTLRAAGIRRDDKVLDVGCGDGALLMRLAEAGFRSLTGVDLFVDSDRTTKSGVSVLKAGIKDVKGTFDFIMFNHAFEHVESPENELREVRRLISTGGRCLIRVPTPSSQAWETYGADWAQLDAPRHFTLISRTGMSALARRCGFAVTRVIDDAQAWSLMASELYRRRIPLSELKDGKYFSREQAAGFAKAAASANASHKGDSVAFVLERADG